MTERLTTIRVRLQKREEERLAEERARSAVTVFFASEGNEGERVAHLVAERLAHESPPVVDLSNVDVEDFSQYMVLFAPK